MVNFGTDKSPLWIPLILGGKDVEELSMKEWNIKYKEAKARNDEKELKRLEKQRKDEEIKDIKLGYKIWVPKQYVIKIPKRKTIKILFYAGTKTKPAEYLTIKIASVDNWSRGTKVLTLEKGQFKHLTTPQVKRMLEYGRESFYPTSLTIEGIKMPTYTLARTRRKLRSTRTPTIYGLSKQLNEPNLEARRRRPGQTKEPKTRRLSDGTVQAWVDPVTYNVPELKKKVNPTTYEVEALSWINKEGERYDREKQVINKKGYIYNRKKQTITKKGYWMKIGFI